MTADFRPWASAPASWITSSGNDFGGTVIASRVRLARNLSGSPFPHYAPEKIQKKIFNEISEASQKSRFLRARHTFRLRELNDLERSFLMERQLISHEHAKNGGEKGLIVTSGETQSIMINEEDHLRLACFKPGLGLNEGWDDLKNIDREFDQYLSFARDEEFGVITACPTNVGTGMRASCLTHLPALVLTGLIHEVLENLNNMGLATRGFYGEGTHSLGDLFQISNSITLGKSETTILHDVETIIAEISQLEKREEEKLTALPYKIRVADKIHRSLGTLTSAHLLNYNEGMTHISLVRLGLKMSLELGVSMDQMTRLFFLAQPAHLRVRQPKAVGEKADEVLRAQYVRRSLKT